MLDLKVGVRQLLCISKYCFLDTDGLDSASQRNVTAEQKKLLAALYRYICAHYEASEADGRYAAILLCIPTIRARITVSSYKIYITFLLKTIILVAETEVLIYVDFFLVFEYSFFRR